MATDRIPPYPGACFALLGPIAPFGESGSYEWRIIIRCQEDGRLTFHRVPMGAGPLELAEQMKESAEALFRSSGYKVEQTVTTVEDWTATWDILHVPS
jgi:hypothetical protein